MAQSRKQAPRAEYNRQADTMHYIADAAAASADTNLLRLPGKPRFAPQMLTLTNRHATNDGAIVLTPEKGVNLTINVRPGDVINIVTPIKAIVDTGTTGGTIDVFCFWWDAGTLNWNLET